MEKTKEKSEEIELICLKEMWFFSSCLLCFPLVDSIFWKHFLMKA